MQVAVDAAYLARWSLQTPCRLQRMESGAYTHHDLSVLNSTIRDTACSMA